MTIFKGSGVALITPFKNGKVDFESLDKLLDWHVEQGTDSIVICGTTGEASTLMDDEHLETIDHTVKKIAGRIPVIAGVGSNSTQHAIDFSMEAEKMGADGLLHVTPYYNKASTKGLILHYQAIAAKTKLPIIMYSVASRTGVNITPAVCTELSKVDNIVGIKEASGNIAQVAEIARVTPDDFDIYSGNDEMVIPLMSVGGIGVISTVANIIPTDVHNMAVDYLNGDVKKAAKAQLDMKALIDAVFIEVNPIPIKAALWLLGKCEYEYKLPMCQMEDKNLEVLKKAMKDYGLL